MSLTLDTHVGPKGTGYLADLRLRSDRPLELMTAVTAIPDVSPDFPLSPRTSDQGAIGSCTGNSSLDSKEDLDRRLTGKDAEWSRLFGYLGGRLLLNGFTLAQYKANVPGIEPRMRADTGARIRDVVTFLNTEGCMSEGLWPYDVTQMSQLPDDIALAQAKRHKLMAMKFLSSSEEIRVALNEKHPVVLGFSVYSSFADVGLDGEFRVPDRATGSGHAVRAVKDDKTHRNHPDFRPGAVLLRNSWGLAWGCKHPTMADQIPGRGFFWMPYEVIDSNDVDDIWAFENSN